VAVAMDISNVNFTGCYQQQDKPLPKRKTWFLSVDPLSGATVARVADKCYSQVLHGELTRPDSTPNFVGLALEPGPRDPMLVEKDGPEDARIGSVPLLSGGFARFLLYNLNAGKSCSMNHLMWFQPVDVVLGRNTSCRMKKQEVDYELCRFEKNWVPHIFDGRIYVFTALDPIELLAFDVETCVSKGYSPKARTGVKLFGLMQDAELLRLSTRFVHVPMSLPGKRPGNVFLGIGHVNVVYPALPTIPEHKKHMWRPFFVVLRMRRSASGEPDAAILAVSCPLGRVNPLMEDPGRVFLPSELLSYDLEEDLLRAIFFISDEDNYILKFRGLRGWLEESVAHEDLHPGEATQRIADCMDRKGWQDMSLLV